MDDKNDPDRPRLEYNAKPQFPEIINVAGEATYDGVDNASDNNSNGDDDGDSSPEEDTSDLFPPTPRSSSPAPDEPQPLGLHRRFGRSNFDDYELVIIHRTMKNPSG